MKKAEILKELKELGELLITTSLNFTHPQFEDSYPEWSTVCNVGERLVLISNEEASEESDGTGIMKLMEVIKEHTLKIEYHGTCNCGGKKYNLITDDGLVYPPVHEISIRNLKPELFEVLE